MVNFDHSRLRQQGHILRPEPGTYALILHCPLTARVQIGRWREIEVQPGYYLYVGSAFGPGGVWARVSRHLRTDKPKHWHIDYLRAFTNPLAVWVSYEPKRLEHQWAQAYLELGETAPIKGFGCSDCKCYAHLFHTSIEPDFTLITTLVGDRVISALSEFPW